MKRADEWKRTAATIPASSSDRLLRSMGFDLVMEYAEIASSLPETAVAPLELATGTGRMTAVLASWFPVVVTGDISLADIARVHQRLPDERWDRVQFLQLDMERLPFRNNSIRAIVCLNTIHETEHPERCIEEMVRTIRNDGTLVIGDFSRTGFDVMQRIEREVYGRDHHEGTMPMTAVEKFLGKRFTNIRTIDTALNRTLSVTGKR